MRRLWDRLASIDPLWAILSDPEKAGRKWRLDEFMESGDREVSLLLYDLKALDAAPALGSALDFGCGIGRLSQAFGRRFASVLGVDISERMIALASRINAYLEVQYRCIPDGTLQGIAGTHFDLIYSNIVLQHIPPDIAEQRIVEFCALLAAGGILVFYVPSHPTVDVAPVSRPMPASAYRASIHVVGSLPMTVRPGEQLSVAATVGNESEIDWEPHAVGSIQLGNHWLDQEASMLIQDDGRSPVSDPLGAGRTSHMTLAVRAPQEEGVFWLELDLVHEGVTWFSDRGSDSVRVKMAVRSSKDLPLPTVERDLALPPKPTLAYDSAAFARTLDDTPVESPGVFPMYGLQRSTVIETLTRSGLELVSVQEDRRAKPEWTGYRYIARRPVSARP